ncbi:c-type cytochrome biogenesis protein CcmF [Arenimonas maotaiensis]|uniref:C-type cytochrome biogenesis protein CcmF n=1 Tax=Arenimonas maotaiensis TaxID=1446479 RepID=A0A917FNF0_9GAMM|nr:heme lyase CcmF/NrfE family subunit [Arenimonas maotaiensis]GGF92795.1 c-type cytochrome biogenesis protein CcmF [Arenimonas maotaiensis]
MLPELGQLALLLAFVLALLLSALPLLGAQRGHEALMRSARPLAYALLAAVTVSYVLLTVAFELHDFSVAYVAKNSNTLLPPMYRISAVWGAHEGSLLLWVLILCLWIAAVALFSKRLPDAVRARVLSVMGMVALGFLAFTVITSNPFERMLPAPLEGHDLNPLLQDPGLIFHPPLLYIGYVGFSVAFAFAIAALIDGRIDTRWIQWARPWTNVAWAFLTLGIALGSFWAYYELGWGGWWFWDPVENASFMPWLVGAALLHSQATTEKRGSFSSWTLLLAIAAFSLSLLGTFLVRSGVLTSVHAFASDPERGMFILAFLCVVVGGSLALFAWRAPKEAGKPFQWQSRESLLLVNNLLLSAAAAMVLLGTLYPLLAEALGLGKVSVGPPYFGKLFLILMAPLVLLIPFGPLSRWQKEDLGAVGRWLLPWLALAALAAVVAYFRAPQHPLKAAMAWFAGLWLLLGTARFVWQRIKHAQGRFTAEMAGMTLAHAGVAVFCFGALMTEGLSVEKDVAAKPGQRFEIGEYRFTFEGVQRVQGPNFVADRGSILVGQGENVDARLHPEKRRYASGGSVMTEADMHGGLTRDLYVALGEPIDDAGGWALRLHVKPFVRWIWFGALMMALGALLVTFDKRFRRQGGAA